MTGNIELRMKMYCWKYPRWRRVSGMSYCASERKLLMLRKHLRLTGERVSFV